MNLTKLDHEFINKYVRKPEHVGVISARLTEGMIPHWILRGGRRTLRTRLGGRGLLGIVSLLAELMSSLAQSKNVSKGRVSIFFVHNADATSLRRSFLRYHRPDEDFLEVSYISRIQRSSFTKDAIIQTVALGKIILQSLYRSSQLAPYMIRILRTCILTYSYCLATSSDTVYIFKLYHIESTFLAAYLRERGIKVNLLPGNTYLSAYNRHLIGDSLKACSPYQIDEFDYHRELSVCKDVELWSPEEIWRLDAHYRSTVNDRDMNTIGVYTQGHWHRLLTGTGQEHFADNEAQFLKTMLRYLESRPTVKLIVYPHPVERAHYEKKGEHQFDEFVNHPRATVDFSGEDSVLTFDQTGLGVVMMSSVGLDRIFMGFRTVFLCPKSQASNCNIDLDVPSRFNQLFAKDAEEFISLMDSVRKMSNSEFMNKYFGGNFWQADKIVSAGDSKHGSSAR